jgi:hypothetical protein
MQPLLVIRERDMLHCLKDDEQMEGPPIELDGACPLQFYKPHYAQIRIRASHGEPEVDSISRHGKFPRESEKDNLAGR